MKYMMGEHGLIKCKEGYPFEEARRMLLRDKLDDLHDAQRRSGAAQKAVERVMFLIEKDVK